MVINTEKPSLLLQRSDRRSSSAGLTDCRRGMVAPTIAHAYNSIGSLRDAVQVYVAFRHFRKDQLISTAAVSDIQAQEYGRNHSAARIKCLTEVVS